MALVYLVGNGWFRYMYPSEATPRNEIKDVNQEKIGEYYTCICHIVLDPCQGSSSYRVMYNRQLLRNNTRVLSSHVI